MSRGEQYNNISLTEDQTFSKEVSSKPKNDMKKTKEKKVKNQIYGM